MSGGHFNYENYRIRDIAHQLEKDIKFNLVDIHGYQLKPKTIGYLKKMVKQLHDLETLLHKYDYVVSGDTAEENFLKIAKEIYKS